MSTRNFEFRVSPRGGERGGRFVLGGSTTLTSGVPVVVSGAPDATGCATVVLATGDQVKPKAGAGGVLVYEKIDFDGLDQVINTYSDSDTVAPGQRVQVVTGENNVKVALINTTATTFLNRTSYPTARIMVAGVSIATPTLAVNDYLTPGTGNATDGYWAKTSTAANGWLVVTAINGDVVEAKMNF